MNTPTPPDKTIIIGRFAGVYAVRGWIKVNAYTDPIEKLLEHSTWLVYHNKQWRATPVEAGKRHGKFLIVKLQGVDDRELAKQYTNDFIAIEREALDEPEADEYYWEDLIGLRVINQDGRALGAITSIMETGSNDVLVIQDDAGQETLVPYLDWVIQSVDLKQGVMHVDWEAE